LNRTDRLLGLLLELQRKRRVRAEDLAAKFETSKRTIYRDIQALSETGVPIVSQPGQGYSLVDGYFLPPLTFTGEEATMLLFGAGLVAGHFDAQYKQAAHAAAGKIEAVLTSSLREEVKHLQESISIFNYDAVGTTAAAEILQQIRRAILDRKTIRFRYHTRYSGGGTSEVNIREANPYGLVYAGTAWYLVAHCHLRQSIRHFRLERVSCLSLLDTTFIRPANFSMKPSGQDRRTIEIRVLFDSEVAPWVREAPSYYMTAAEDTPEGLLVTLKARFEPQILQWLLSWGSKVRVLEPESLRKLLAAEAEAIAKKNSATDITLSHRTATMAP
jgi:predicted DNA-binding transcriptional regulator YafY